MPGISPAGSVAAGSIYRGAPAGVISWGVTIPGMTAAGMTQATQGEESAPPIPTLTAFVRLAGEGDQVNIIAGQSIASIQAQEEDDAALFESSIPTLARLQLAMADDGVRFPALHEFTRRISPYTSRTYYACEIDDGILPAIRPPISSWQATVQSGRASYAQAVIPAAMNWVDEINARPGATFRIYRGVLHADGTIQESMMASSPVQSVSYQRGSRNATVTISGYSSTEPTGESVRKLEGVRSVSVSPTLRARAAIDWFIRPGDTAAAEGIDIPVDYINYYCSPQDQYMDVGERGGG